MQLFSAPYRKFEQKDLLLPCTKSYIIHSELQIYACNCSFHEREIFMQSVGTYSGEAELRAKNLPVFANGEGRCNSFLIILNCVLWKNVIFWHLCTHLASYLKLPSFRSPCANVLQEHKNNVLAVKFNTFGVFSYIHIIVSTFFTICCRYTIMYIHATFREKKFDSQLIACIVRMRCCQKCIFQNTFL